MGTERDCSTRAPLSRLCRPCQSCGVETATSAGSAEPRQTASLGAAAPLPLHSARLSHASLCSVFLPAADIPRFVAEGNVDLGITGQDMVAEAGLSSELTEELELGFGKCALQVQVPESSSFKEPKDLVGKKVATSFDRLAGEYFAKLQGDEEKKTIIEYVGGSVEAACALGLADGIGECERVCSSSRRRWNVCAGLSRLALNQPSADARHRRCVQH